MLFICVSGFVVYAVGYSRFERLVSKLKNLYLFRSWVYI